MDQLTWLIILIVSLVLSGLFSGVEMAYVSSDSVRVRLDVSRGGLINHLLNIFYSSSDLFISTILVGNNVVLVIYGMGAAYFLEPWIEAHITHNEALILLMQTLISTGVILITGEFLPKAVFRINPNTSLKIFAVPVFLFYLALYPVSWFTTWLSQNLMRLFGIKTAATTTSVLSVGDLNQYLEKTIDPVNSPKAAAVVENEVKMFHNALDFSTTHLRDCMIPRNEIVAVNIDTVTTPELSELFTVSGRSKIIVYRDDIDNVLGYIHVSELFIPGADWKSTVKPVIFVPETLLANKLMRRLLSEKRSMAIVVDEFGGTSGLVTLEDLVEEIFGDIQDEHDRPDMVARRINDDEYEFSGRMEIETLRETYHIDIPEDDEYQTLAGYIITSTGIIPHQGDTLTINGLEFTVTSCSATRLELIRVKRLSEK